MQSSALGGETVTPLDQVDGQLIFMKLFKDVNSLDVDIMIPGSSMEFSGARLPPPLPADEPQAELPSGKPGKGARRQRTPLCGGWRHARSPCPSKPFGFPGPSWRSDCPPPHGLPLRLAAWLDVAMIWLPTLFGLYFAIDAVVKLWEKGGTGLLYWATLVVLMVMPLSWLVSLALCRWGRGAPKAVPGNSREGDPSCRLCCRGYKAWKETKNKENECVVELGKIYMTQNLNNNQGVQSPPDLPITSPPICPADPAALGASYPGKSGL